jgi:hypothetical protein
MNKLDTASPNVATLETAPTRYVEGHDIRFACRRLGSATGTPPLVLLQHFSGNIDAWDPAVVNALAAATIGSMSGGSFTRRSAATTRCSA